MQAFYIGCGMIEGSQRGNEPALRAGSPLACRTKRRFGRGAFLLCIGVGVTVGAGCSRSGTGTPPPTAASPASSLTATALAPELVRSVQHGRQQFRAAQDARMRGELSPLARIDYIHLPAGEHRVGGSAAATVRLDAAASGLGESAQLRLRVEADGALRRLALRAAPPVLRNRVAVSESVLASGDVLTLGRLNLLVTGLPEDPAVAIYDSAAKPRVEYAGLHYFPDDEHLVVRGRLERYAQPRAVRLEASRGEPRPLQALGTLRFTLNGQPAAMEAYSDSPATAAAPEQLFLIFKDRTNGQPEGSYGAGRFLTTAVRAGDEVILDFNQAWNPLCAYSPYFHCPLPPRSNWLPFAIPAGERAYAEH